MKTLNEWREAAGLNNPIEDVRIKIDSIIRRLYERGLHKEAEELVVIKDELGKYLLNQGKLPPI